MGLSIAYLIDHLESNYPRDRNYIIKYMMEQGHNIIVFTSLDRKFSKISTWETVIPKYLSLYRP